MFQTSCHVTVLVELLELFLPQSIDWCDGPDSGTRLAQLLHLLNLHVAAAAAGGMSVALRVHDWNCHQRLD